MKIVKTGSIKAPTKAVFKGLTDIRYFRNEILRFSTEDNPRIQYDRKDPFGVGKSIFLLTDEPKIRYKVIENRPPELMKFEITGNKRVTEMAGFVTYTATLEELGDLTKYTYTYESSKDPSKKMTRLMINIIMFYIRLSLFKSNRRFIKHVQREISKQDAAPTP